MSVDELVVSATTTSTSPEGAGASRGPSLGRCRPRAPRIARLRVSVLETVSITRLDGEPFTIGALQQKVMLTLLVAYANRSVPVDRIADELWGERRPRRWDASIRTLANSLRRTAGDHSLIHWTGRGYRLHRHDDMVETDIDQMTSAIADARVAMHEERLADAERLARRALGYYGTGPWTSDVWCWSDLAADAYVVLGRALLTQGQHLRCLLELSRAPEELNGHEALRSCLRRAEQAVRSGSA